MARMNNTVKELKEKLENYKICEKNLQDEKSNLLEKVKIYKNDIIRKENFIKDLKEKIDGESRFNQIPITNINQSMGSVANNPMDIEYKE